MPEEDFWPEITPGKMRTPVTVLREQAGLLGQKTRNLVVGEVRSGQDENGFAHNLNLVAPALGRYTYVAVTISHGIALYPVRILDRVRPTDPVVATSEEGLKRELRRILSSPEMKHLIEALIAQSVAVTPEPVTS